MIEISLNKICKTYGFNNVLDNVSFEIKTNEIVSLIGDNGSGKSTILNIINKDENVDSGTISIRKGNTIGYLKQIPDSKDNYKVEDILYENVKEVLDIEKLLRKYEHKMTTVTGKELDKLLLKYSNLQDKFISLDGYNINNKINKIVNGFKINHLLDKNYNNLSGGEKRIVSLASIMIKNPSILLLDEPTNHLDIDTLEWFEDYLKKYNGTVLIVSHDRYFLDKVSTKTILLERGKNYIFHGNYSYYVEENNKRIEKEFKDFKDQQKLIVAMKKKIKQLEEFGRLAYPGGDPFYRRAENIRKRLERLDKVDKPIVKKDLPINFNIGNRSGKDVLTIKDYDLKINDKLLIKDININIKYKYKVCILGNNGCGKSTLVKNIIDNNSENIRLGTNIKIGYIPQDIEFNEDISILEYTRRFFNDDESHLRSALNKFYFHGENVFKKINKLSGGEKVRLKLFELIQTNSNFLILDEPTNHIDIATKEILENALKEFDGTILFISHDRYFINNLANKILYINKNYIEEYVGNYDQNKNLR